MKSYNPEINLTNIKPNTNRLWLLLCLTTLFDFCLSAYRLYYLSFDFSQINTLSQLSHFRGYPTFLFLVWNLFLAWIPYWCSSALKYFPNSKLIAFFLLLIWVLFLPNAPYIITDLMHIKHRPPVPLWFDVLLIFSYAWTGILLAFASIIQVQDYFKNKIPLWLIHSVTILLIFLTGIGIFIGRFQRWNSWDIITNPIPLFLDIIEVLLNPNAYLGTFGIAFVLTALLSLGFYTLRELGNRV